MHVNSISYFRGISIIFIVFGHCLGIADFTYNSIIGNSIHNLTQGGTSFFVFISGFMFHYIYYKKFIFKKFIIKKSKYVLIPYLILSTLPILYLLVNLSITAILSLRSFSTYQDALFNYPMLMHYLTGVGKNFTGYWYIPFIMVVFLISPIFIKFIKLKLKTQLLITLSLLICSLFMQRGTYMHFYSVFQNVIFFTPLYLMGIIFSEKKDIIFSKLRGKEFYILGFAIILALYQAYMGKFGNYYKDPFVFGGIDLIIIQKTLLCFFFMIFLNRFENHKLRFLDVIATNSFGIFFLHGIILVIIEMVKEKSHFSFTSNSYPIYLLLTIFVFILSLIATILIKRIFPKPSKYLVGS